MSLVIVMYIFGTLYSQEYNYCAVLEKFYSHDSISPTIICKSFLKAFARCVPLLFACFNISIHERSNENPQIVTHRSTIRDRSSSFSLSPAPVHSMDQ